MRKDKIRILHIAQAAGGVDRYIRMLLKYLDKEKFENILVCSQDFREEDYKNLVDFFEQVKMDRAIGSNDLKAIGEVRRLIKRYNPDIVYAHSSKAGAIARVADIGLKNHCLYNPHGWAFNMRCSAKKKDLNIPEDAFVVGMVGRISPQKAPDIFIKMAKHVKDKVSNAHFIIVGNGDQEAEIKKYAKDNDFLDSLHITGWVDNPMSYVELFDVACLLSRWEGFGLVLPEYMMARKPIVASRVDAIPNIICDGENGLLVEMDDVVGASTAVLKLYLNNNLKSKLIDEGLKTVYKKFDVQRMTRETEKLFEEVTR